MPVANLPDRMNVASVQAEFVDGPVLAQRTDIRQRPGVFPALFDKLMVREDVGHGERLLVLSIHEDGVPDDVDAAFLRWRSLAEAAAGALASVLDERVAGVRIFEDAILLSSGDAIGAMDIQERVRSFLPLDVTAIDRPAIESLADIDLGDGPGIGRAARLYRRAALEGPTADAYVMLWVAAESILETRQPRKVDLDALLLEAGMNPDGLPLHTGLLISLRGKIMHEGLEDSERLRTAFYEMEAIVRVLIRRNSDISGGWWPTHDLATYADPWPDRFDASDTSPRTVWHDDAMPAVLAPARERVPRKVRAPDLDLLVTITERLAAAAGDHLVLITTIAAEARMWLAPDMDDELLLDLRDGRGYDIEPERIVIGADCLSDLDRADRFVALTVDLHGVLGSWVALREVAETGDGGTVVRSAIGAWFQYQRLVVDGELPPELLKLPASDSTDLFEIGRLAGWAAAGNARAAEIVDTLAPEIGDLARDLRDQLRTSPPAPPRPVLTPATRELRSEGDLDASAAV